VAALFILAAAGVWTFAGRLDAQVITPGKLSAAHSPFEGIRHCTQCHDLGTRGIANEKCLACHTPLRSRIQRHTGYHAGVRSQNCATCHRDHFGVAFQLVRLDTAAFDHREAGFALEGAHRETDCRECHTEAYIADPDVRAFKGKHHALARTFLGVATACRNCHSSDDPHGRQFIHQECRDCHTATTWHTGEAFDHTEARFRLTGLHRRVQCEECHESRAGTSAGSGTQYVGLTFSRCDACHRDVHNGVMADACDACHSTAGWQRINGTSFEGRFDHDKTDFPLLDAHSRLECGACHGKAARRTAAIHIIFAPGSQRFSYPRPLGHECQSCHRDYHEQAFEATPGGAGCDKCHSQEGWIPTSYGIERHNLEAAFHLTGAHQAVPCAACHDEQSERGTRHRFRIEPHDCRACHDRTDPHAGQFGRAPCGDCHDTDSFLIADFDHDGTRYPLDGAHRRVACTACHREERSPEGTMVRRYRPLGTACTDCHGDEP